MTDQMPTAADIRHFREEGYWVAPVLLRASELEALRQAFSQIYIGKLDHPVFQGRHQALSRYPSELRDRRRKARKTWPMIFGASAPAFASR